MTRLTGPLVLVVGVPTLQLLRDSDSPETPSLRRVSPRYPPLAPTCKCQLGLADRGFSGFRALVAFGALFAWLVYVPNLPFTLF